MDDKMALYVWPEEKQWGLPSMDLLSLQMLSYVKFAGAPVVIIKTASPSTSPSKTLPCFVCSEGVITDFWQMTKFLRKHNYSCDYELTHRQCSEVVAYESFLHEKLYPAIIYLWWVEPKSYYDIIHKWYFSNIPLPYKLWYPRKFHKEGVQLICSLYDDAYSLESVETEIHKHAQECLTLLSTRLGDREYFFGSSPTTLDASLLAYLAILLQVDLKVPVLQNHIKACPNLLSYVTRTLGKYFPKDKQNKPAVIPVLDDVPNKGRNLLISGLVAFGAMLGYAVAAGLVQVDLGEGIQDVEEDEYDYEAYEKGGSDD